MSRRDLWDQVVGDLYQLLGVESSASADEIQVAWRSTAKRLHPDRGGSVTEFQHAEIAYQVLSDPLERGRYDRMRRQSQPSSAPNPGARQYAYSYSYTAGGQSSRPTNAPYFDPDSPDPYGDARSNTTRKPRNPWLVALAILLGILAVVAAIMLALVTFLVLFAGVILLVGRGLTGRAKPDRTSP